MLIFTRRRFSLPSCDKVACHAEYPAPFCSASPPSSPARRPALQSQCPQARPARPQEPQPLHASRACQPSLATGAVHRSGRFRSGGPRVAPAGCPFFFRLREMPPTCADSWCGTGPSSMPSPCLNGFRRPGCATASRAPTCNLLPPMPSISSAMTSAVPASPATPIRSA